VYLDTNLSEEDLWRNDKKKSAEFYSRFRRIGRSGDDIPLSDRHYLLRPLTLTMLIVLNSELSPEAKIPQYDISLKVDDISVAISQSHYTTASRLLNIWSGLPKKARIHQILANCEAYKYIIFDLSLLLSCVYM